MTDLSDFGSIIFWFSCFFPFVFLFALWTSDNTMIGGLEQLRRSQAGSRSCELLRIAVAPVIDAITMATVTRSGSIHDGDYDDNNDGEDGDSK